MENKNNKNDGIKQGFTVKLEYPSKREALVEITADCELNKLHVATMLVAVANEILEEISGMSKGYRPAN